MFQQILQRLSFVVSPDICTPVCTYLKVKMCRTVVTLKNVCNHFVTHRASQKEVRAGPYYYISCDGPTGRPAGLFRLSFMVGLVREPVKNVLADFVCKRGKYLVILCFLGHLWPPRGLK